MPRNNACLLQDLVNIHAVNMLQLFLLHFWPMTTKYIPDSSPTQVSQKASCVLPSYASEQDSSMLQMSKTHDSWGYFQKMFRTYVTH